MYPIISAPRKIKLQPDYSTIYVNTGRIYVNESAASILRLCNGTNTPDDIIEQLIIKYDEKPEIVTDFVREFLDYSLRLGTVTPSASRELAEITVQGNTTYWTPDAVVLELTHNCPLSCRHCFLDAGHGNSMGKEMLMPLCEEMVTMGVDMVQLTGGEPLIYPGVDAIIEFFIQRDIRLSITTSGIVNSPKTNQAIARMKGTGGWVQVSLDGLEDTHNQMRGNRHGYSSAVAFIQKMIALGIDVDVATTVTQASFDELEPLCQQLKAWGVRTYRIGVISERGRAIDNGLGSPASLRRMVAEKRRALKARYDSPRFHVSGFEDDLIGDPHARQQENCGAGYRILKISPDGNVHPCPLMNWPIGSLQDHSLTEITQRNGKRFALMLSPSPQQCGTCSNLVFCKGCMAEALQYCGTVERCNWKTSQAAGAGLY